MVIGPIKNEGNDMEQAVLNAKERVITRCTIRKIRKYEILCETEKLKRIIFEDLIKKNSGDSMAQPKKPVPTEYEPYSDDSEPASVQLPEDTDPVKTDGTTSYENLITDRWTHAEMNMTQGEAIQNAKVIGRATDQYGNVIGTYDDNP